MFFHKLLTCGVLMLSAACTTTPPPTKSQTVGVWEQVGNTTAWSIRMDDPGRKHPLYVSVDVPIERPASITIIRSCTEGDRREISDVHLYDDSIFTIDCNGRSVPLSSDLVTQLTQLPEPPIEIRYEVVDLLFHAGRIADGNTS